MLQVRGKVDPFSDVPLREVLGRIGEDMGELARAVHRIQSLLGMLVPERAFSEHRNFQEMQGLALVARKIECLSDFMAALSRDLPEFWRVDTREAAQLMALSELSARVTFSEDAPVLDVINGGDFEPF